MDTFWWGVSWLLLAAPGRSWLLLPGPDQIQIQMQMQMLRQRPRQRQRLLQIQKEICGDTPATGDQSANLGMRQQEATSLQLPMHAENC